MIPKSFTQIDAGTDTQQNIGNYKSTRIRNIRQPHRFSNADQWLNPEPTTSAFLKMFHQFRI